MASRLIAFTLFLVSLITANAQDIKERTLKHAKDFVTGMAFTKDGTELYSASMNGTIVRWDLKNGKSIWKTDLDAGGTKERYTISNIFGLALSPDGRLIAVTYDTDSVKNDVLQNDRVDKTSIFDSATGRLLREMVAERTGFTFSPDSRYLITLGKEPIAKFWNVDTGSLERSVTVIDTGSPVALKDGKRLLVNTGTRYGSFSPMVRIYNIENGEVIQDFPSDYVQVTGLGLSRDERQIAIGGFNAWHFSIRVWKLGEKTQPEPPNLLPEGSQVGYELAFSPDGDKLASSGFTVLLKAIPLRTIQFRRIADNKVYKTIHLSDDVNSTAVSADGKLVAFGLENGQILIKKF